MHNFNIQTSSEASLLWLRHDSYMEAYVFRGKH